MASHRRGGANGPGHRVSAAVEAFVAGFEVQTRVAVAAGPGHYDAGWHVTGTDGHIGAAVATARLLGLSPDRRSPRSVPAPPRRRA